MNPDYSTFPEQLDQLLKQLDTFAFAGLRSEDLPNIDLYMDQVTTFMDRHLNAAAADTGEKLLTKTMINNYTKNKLLPPPEKKKYSREHMVILAFIYYFKNVMSLQDIQSLLTPLHQDFFRPDILSIYDEVRSVSEQNKEFLQAGIRRYQEEAAASFADAPEKDRDFLRFFMLISLLALDAAAKKEIIGQLIREVTADKTK